VESLAKKYKEAVRAYPEDWVAYHPDEQTGVPLSIIEDGRRGHFLLMETGFGKKGWVSRLFIYFRVSEGGKVILLKNNTTEEPLEELVEKGVEATDFLLAWREPALVAMFSEQKAAQGRE